MNIGMTTEEFVVLPFREDIAYWPEKGQLYRLRHTPNTVAMAAFLGNGLRSNYVWQIFGVTFPAPNAQQIRVDNR